MINISCLSVPIDKKNTKLKDAMYLTSQALYESKSIPFKKLHRIVSSDLRQYSPFEFKNAIKKSENWSNENQNILILDIDDGLSIDEAKKIFKDYTYFICTTKSHQQDKKGIICDRFRIILKAINIPKNDEYFKYMRQLELLFPFIDKQVNTKTGAFLGSSNCKYWYNEGISFDFNIIKPVQTKEVYIVREAKEHTQNMEVQQIKSLLNQEIIAEILNHNGFEVDRNFKLMLRDERTPSTSISRDGLIKDFGSGWTGDIFSVLMEFKEMSFPNSIDEVRKYVL